jgi:cell division protein FtsL
VASPATAAPSVLALRRTRAVRGRRANVLRSGVFWIVVVSALLAGVVALNVAVLQLNVRFDRLSRERANLRADNAALASQLSSSSAAPRIQSLAQKRLGLVVAPSDATTYVQLAR